MNGILKRILPLFSCLAILISAAVFLNNSGLPTAMMGFIWALSYVMFIFGLFLSIRFNRSRAFFIQVTIISCQLLYLYLTKDYIKTGTSEILLRSTLFLLISTNMLIFTQLKEKGIFSIQGKIYMGFIFFEIVYSALSAASNKGAAARLINTGIIPLNFLSLYSVSVVSLIMFLVAIAILIFRILNKGVSSDNVYIGVLFSIFIALLSKRGPVLLPVFFTISDIFLIVSIIHDSYKMAYLDELTGLPGRRALRESLMNLGSRYSIAMLDIDFFKRLNDTYGHKTGDEVLQFIASILKQTTGGGRAFRYGGEEFAIIFSGKRLSESMLHIEKLREKIEKSPFPCKTRSGSGSKSKKIHITVSGGIAEKSEKNRTSAEVINAADQALYRAKNKGRNCISK